jgi:hypothetical protein
VWLASGVADLIAASIPDGWSSMETEAPTLIRRDAETSIFPTGGWRNFAYQIRIVRWQLEQTWPGLHAAMGLGGLSAVQGFIWCRREIDATRSSYMYPRNG